MVERLAHLGLTQYEARAYVALVRRDGSTPAEIARVAGVPRPRIYDVVASLVAKGLACERPGRTTKFVATPPEEATAKMMNLHRERLQALEADAEAVRTELGPAYSEGSAHSDPLDYIELIRSPEGIAKRYFELQRSVKSEILVLSKMPMVVRVEENDVGIEVAHRFTTRAIYEFSLLDDPESRDGIQRFIEAGEQARFVEELPMKLGIIDERIVMLTMLDPVAGEGEMTTLVIEHAQLARTLKLAFELIWATGVSFAAACKRRGVDSGARSAR